MANHFPITAVGPTATNVSANPILLSECLPGGRGPLWGSGRLSSALQTWAPFDWHKNRWIKGFVFQVIGDKHQGKSTLGMYIPWRVSTFSHITAEGGAEVAPIIRMYNMRANDGVPELYGVTNAMDGLMFTLKGHAINIFDLDVGLDAERIRELLRELMEIYGTEPISDKALEVLNIAVGEMITDAEKRKVRPSIEDLIGFVTQVTPEQQNRYLTELSGSDTKITSPMSKDELRQAASEATTKLGNFLSGNGQMFNGTGSMRSAFEEQMLTWDFTGMTVPEMMLAYKVINTVQRNAIDRSIRSMMPTMIVIDEAWQLRQLPDFNPEDLRLRKLTRANDIVYINISHRRGDNETGADATTASYKQAVYSWDEIDCLIIFRMEKKRDLDFLRDDIHLTEPEIDVVRDLGVGECYVVMDKGRFGLQGFLTSQEKVFTDTDQAVQRVTQGV